MKTGTLKIRRLEFFKIIIMGILMVAFVANAQLIGSEKTETGNNDDVYLAEILPETVIIDSGFTPPVSSAAIASNAHALTLSSQKLNLQTYSISPRDISFTPNKKRNAGFTAAMASTVLLHAADYYTTVNALKYSTLEEGNPFMKKITNNHLLFGAIKLGVAGLQVTLLKGLFKKNKTLAWIVGTAMNVALSGVVASNLSKIQKAKSCLGY